MFSNFLLWLKISRPGLWFATIWLYILPTSGMPIWDSSLFWLGFIYITFPLNFLVYGWNDMTDYDIDVVNPRKDSFWFGARASKDQLKTLWIPILISQLICIPFFVWIIGWKMLGLQALQIFVNFLYNHPKYGLSSRPPFELICQIGYLLVVPFSVWLNETAALPWVTYLYLLLFAIQSHLIGEVMDIEPDRNSGRRTTATVLGMKKTKLLIIFIVAVEVSLILFVYQDFLFGGMLLAALVWLLIDLFIIFKSQIYTVKHMKLFGLLSNTSAIASMAYVWYSGCLV